MGITEHAYYRGCNEYDGMKTIQGRRLKDPERENGRLKKAVIKLFIICTFAN